MIKYTPIVCSQCSAIVAMTSSYPEQLDYSDTLCVACYHKKEAIAKERELTGRPAKFACKVCKEFDDESAVEVMTHIMERHREIGYEHIQENIIEIT